MKSLSVRILWECVSVLQPSAAPRRNVSTLVIVSYRLFFVTASSQSREVYTKIIQPLDKIFKKEAYLHLECGVFDLLSVFFFSKILRFGLRVLY